MLRSRSPPAAGSVSLPPAPRAPARRVPPRPSRPRPLVRLLFVRLLAFRADAQDSPYRPAKCCRPSLVTLIMAARHLLLPPSFEMTHWSRRSCRCPRLGHGRRGGGAGRAVGEAEAPEARRQGRRSLPRGTGSRSPRPARRPRPCSFHARAWRLLTRSSASRSLSSRSGLLQLQLGQAFGVGRWLRAPSLSPRLLGLLPASPWPARAARAPPGGAAGLLDRAGEPLGPPVIFAAPRRRFAPQASAAARSRLAARLLRASAAGRRPCAPARSPVLSGPRPPGERAPTPCGRVSLSSPPAAGPLRGASPRSSLGPPSPGGEPGRRPS